MVDEDLLALFSEDDEEIARAVRHFVALAAQDSRAEEQLIDLLDLSLEHQNDDSSASVWTAVILGELRSRVAIPLLLRALLVENDEQLQDAAEVALLRIGEPAVEALMTAVEEEGHPHLNRRVYGALGSIGVLDDEFVRDRVMEFLASRVSAERREAPEERGLVDLCGAIARVGDRRQIPVLKELYGAEFASNHPAVLDAIELLEENEAGVAIRATIPPWEERYGWIFAGEDDDAPARVSRAASGQLTFELRQRADEEDEETSVEPQPLRIADLFDSGARGEMPFASDSLGDEEHEDSDAEPR